MFTYAINRRVSQSWNLEQIFIGQGGEMWASNFPSCRQHFEFLKSGQSVAYILPI